MRKSFLILWISLALATGVRAAGTNGLANSDCLLRLAQLIEELETMEQAVTNDTPRAVCIADKLNKVKGLAELTHSLHEAAVRQGLEEDPEALASDRAMLKTACERAEKLVADAVACRSTPVTASKKHAPPAPAPAKPAAIPANILVPSSAVRDTTTCLKQAKLAMLLTQVMGLEVAESVEAPSHELANLGVQPLGGWVGDECVTGDDLCVVVARALKLKVTSTNDPYSYVLAVRNDGLPVDSVLPRRTRESVPAVLLESEVRLFLARGYAARMPSSQRLLPD